MKLTILGAGVGACIPGTSTEHLHPPGFLVEWNDQKMLFECSEGIRFRLEKAGHPIETIHHLAISHSHPDHYCLPPFLQGIHLKGMWGGKKYTNSELHIYCPDAIANSYANLRKIHWLDLHPQPDLDNNFHPMSTTTKSISIGKATLKSENAFHYNGKLDALCYRLDTPEGIFAYSGDTGEGHGVRAVAKDADIFVCESSSSLDDDKNAFEYGHLNARQAGQIAKEAGAKKLVLFHYSGLNTDAEMTTAVKETGFAGEVVIAKDGMILNI